MSANKHAAVTKWLSKCPFLTDNVVFDFLNERQGSVALVPVAGETWIKRYVRGTGIKAYQFAVQVMLASTESDDSTNTDNMYLLDTWRGWIEEQETQKNYPNFGKRCSDFELTNLSNMAQPAQRFASGFTKYTFYAQLKYLEKGA